MPSHRDSSIPSNSSSASLSSHGTPSDDLSSSLTRVEIVHNDSCNSLSSLATSYLSDEDTITFDSHRTSSRRRQSLCQRRPTPVQSAIFLRRDLNASGEDEDEDNDNDKNGDEEENENQDQDDSDFWDQMDKHGYPYDRSIVSPSLESSNEIRDDEIEDGQNSYSTRCTAENNDLSDLQCPSRESINREWVTAKVLVEKLAHYPSSKASLSSLTEDHGFHVKSVLALISCNTRIFMLKEDTVYLRPQISICLSHLSLDGCQSESTCEGLHICPEYVAGKCKDEECSLGHSGDTGHNMRILNEFCLQSIPSHLLQKVIGNTITNQRRPSLLKVCEEYNMDVCEKESCKNLHICKFYIAGLARCPRLFCRLNHSFSEDSVERILENHGLNLRESPKDIVKALHKVNPHLAEQLPFVTNEKESQMPITVWATYACGDVIIAEICSNSVGGHCEYERSGCKRLHCERTFHWQVREIGCCWLNLTKTQVYWLELAYCDPEQDYVILPQLDYTYLQLSIGELAVLLSRRKWEASFETENGTFTLTADDDALELRRLCCEDTEMDIPGTEFLWYYQNRSGNFIEYGSIDPAGEGYDDLSEISSQCLENFYQKLMEGSSKMHFNTDKYTYVIDLTTMIQENEEEKTKCKVRRRPKPHITEVQK